jgi:DNA-directed RNA polymerase subunit RPC12/RpoP
MKEVVITKERFAFKECESCTAGEDIYYCPECESAIIERGDNYCPNCGAKIVWKLK